MLQLVFLLSLFAVLLSMCFFPLHLGFLAFVALVPLFRAIVHDVVPGGKGIGKELRTGFARGWLGGVLFFGVTFYWIPLLPAENVTVPLIMFPAYLLMVVYLALYIGLFGALIRLAYARVTRRVLFLAPFFWVVVELLRASGALGFPWASLGYSLHEYPALIQWSSFGSVYGVSFVLVTVNALVYESLVRRIRPLVGISMAGVLVLAMFVTGHAMIPEETMNSAEVGSSGVAGKNSEKELTIGLVQCNTASSIKWDPRFRTHNFSVLLEQSGSLGRHAPDLIVWPETAAPFHLRYEPDYMELLLQTVNRERVPFLIGFPDALPGGRGGMMYYNSAGLIMPGRGLVRKYDKIHLVPFGERIPYDDLLPFLKRVDFGEADFERGKERTVFKLNDESFSVLICFESIFPELVRSFKVNGADFFVNITNDEWFGRTAAPYQHAYMVVFRAVETRSSIARCANTGISMLVDPWGRVTLKSGLFTREALVGRIRIVPAQSFFTRHGFLLIWPVVGIAALEAFLALALRRT